ncbi:MAG: protein translocase subunit SecF [Oscillospiraceae bacterium]
MTNIDFVGKKKIFFTISLILIGISLLCAMIFGVKIAIEFKGGTLINYSYEGTLDTKLIKEKVEEQIGEDVIITEGQDFNNNTNTIQISFAKDKGLTADKQFELTKKLQADYAANSFQLISSSDVSPSSGREFFDKCWVAVAFASILLVLYIAWRFKKIGGWSAGVMAVVALIHDVALVFGTFVIFRIPIDANFMAVVLTILGYSINDTIVIYDRIRENKKLLGKNISRADLVNKSINQSLSRSINTSICTVSSMIIVSIVAVIFHVDSILSFSFPLIIGITAGAYSTICIAGPLWVWWEGIMDKRKAAKKLQKKALKKA